MVHHPRKKNKNTSQPHKTKREKMGGRRRLPHHNDRRTKVNATVLGSEHCLISCGGGVVAPTIDKQQEESKRATVTATLIMAR